MREILYFEAFDKGIKSKVEQGRGRGNAAGHRTFDVHRVGAAAIRQDMGRFMEGIRVG